MTEQYKNDPRADLTTARNVDHGLGICAKDGLSPALQFLERAGVPKSVVHRVFCSPQYFRKQDRRSASRPGAGGQ
jgi:hypothetical protein